MLVLRHVELLVQELKLCHQGLVLEQDCHIELLVLHALGQQDLALSILVITILVFSGVRQLDKEVEVEVEGRRV